MVLYQENSPAGYSIKIPLRQPLSYDDIISQANWCYSNSIDAYFSPKSVSFISADAAILYRLKWGIQ